MANLKFVFCTLLFLCISLQVFSQSSSIPFPRSLINEMAKRENRYHHYLWHNIREGWNRFNSTSQEALRKLGWAPPRPGRAYDANGVSSAIPENGSGEDFLYMHRQMIAKANDFLKKNREPYGKITGWSSIPSPTSTEYPVPPPYNVTGNPTLTSYTNVRKVPAYWNNTIQPMAKFLRDPVNLRNMTLSELGARIEVGIHSWMHMRWSGNSSYGYRPTNRSALPVSFDKRWDDPRYNWMGDTYASHVNPVFWKLHGWVDDRIEDWRKANNLTSIRWKGTWTGGPMSSFASILKKEKKANLRGSAGDAAETEHTEEVGDVMEQALKIVLQENSKEVSFADEVKIDFGFEPTLVTETKVEPKKNSKPKSLNQKQRSLCRSRVLKKKN